MKLTTVNEYAEQEVHEIHKELSTSSQYKLLKVIEIITGSNWESDCITYTPDEILQAAIKLLNMQPISPIKGLEDEWVEVEEQIGGVKVEYNKRLRSLIRKDGKVYHTDAIRFRDLSNGCTIFYGSVEGVESSKEITKFPYTPNYQTVDVIQEHVYNKENDSWEFDYNLKSVVKRVTDFTTTVRFISPLITLLHT